MKSIAEVIEAHQRGLYHLCQGPASSTDEPVCLTELVAGPDLERLKLSAAQGLMAHVERDVASGRRVTAMGPVQFCITPLVSPSGSYRVLAHVRYARRRR